MQRPSAPGGILPVRALSDLGSRAFLDTVLSEILTGWDERSATSASFPK
jgi:hypothetical protein